MDSVSSIHCAIVALVIFPQIPLTLPVGNALALDLTDMHSHIPVLSPLTPAYEVRVGHWRQGDEDVH